MTLRGRRLHGIFTSQSRRDPVRGSSANVRPSARGLRYPYDEREAARRQLPWRKRLLNLPAADAAILLTHAGPDGSGTTVVTGRDADSIERPGEVRARPLHAGSPALGELLAQKKAQARVVLHVHGRAHAAAGVARVGAALVVNPGSLRYTNTYASATLAELRTFEEDGPSRPSGNRARSS